MSGKGRRALGRYRIRLTGLLAAVAAIAWLGAFLEIGVVRVAADSPSAFYAINAPKSICPGETGTVRLTVQLPAGLAPSSLLTLPSHITQPTPEHGLSGSLDPCQQLWGKLQASNLEVVGAPALQRTVQSSSTEWDWEVYCPRDIQTPAKGTLTILLFARQANADGVLADIPLKDIRFDVPIVAKESGVSSSLLLAILLLLGVVVLFAAGWLRRRSDQAGEKRSGGRS